MVASVLWSYLVYQWSVTGIIRMSTKLPLRKILNRINGINTQKAEKMIMTYISITHMKAIKVF